MIVMFPQSYPIDAKGRFTEHMMTEKNLDLPYEFDLLYDVKSMRDVEDIAAGRPSRCEVTPKELINLFIQHRISVPECLMKNFDGVVDD